MATVGKIDTKPYDKLGIKYPLQQWPTKIKKKKKLKKIFPKTSSTSYSRDNIESMDFIK